ncbi:MULTISPECIES: proton-conducting transporter membrane subunit [unclassified Campylobacter]|uniref:NADH-quinone oxidoreductase subunit N n=1 Tax=unclassified Campylobacter TaxID=2593542 RepID=UPI001BDAA70F|nr:MULTISPECIES: proton-conducting transporter membrane subunit [unclassified Campylobacter]MBZ7976377.1 hypothetical protein [Campylobacter sp. RM12637]MBZ7977939.1 hypothetical protein [Campylobacter sp. RM12654]MBZ7980044.1 hypothetical protein [Campylobacter sp. RM12642]MBZ8007499.1 hypothetical protein [Campylobacter sp. RM9334]MBT0878125.1 hypothetical protein [Campylobacter sp. 2018MI01]
MQLDLNVLLILPELALIVFACFILVANLFYKFDLRALKGLSIVALIIAIICQFNCPYDESFFDLFIFDNLAKYSSILINLSAIYFLLANKRADEGEFFALFLMMIACLNFMVSTNNLIVAFITLEGSSLALYSLIAFKKKAIEGAIKYFNYGMLGSAFFAMGSAMYYFDSASLELNSLATISTASILAFVMIGITILFKLSVAPLHMWLKDVYLKADSSLAGFISIVPKIAMMVFAYRFMISFENFFNVSEIILIIACASMLFASVMSLKQDNAKSMLVYSSVSHSSFAYSTLAFFHLSSQMFLYYFLTFAFVNIALFMFLGAFKDTNYENLKGVFKKYPLLGICIVVLLLNLAALPPFGVFFAKVGVINIALNVNIYAAICMALSSIIMLFAYLRFIKAIFADKEIGFLYFNNAQKIVLILAVIASFVASVGLDYIK